MEVKYIVKCLIIIVLILLLIIFIIGLIGSWLRISESLYDFLEEKKIKISPKKYREIRKNIISKYYKKNFFVIGQKGTDLTKKIKWYIQTELMIQIESSIISIENYEKSKTNNKIKLTYNFSWVLFIYLFTTTLIVTSIIGQFLNDWTLQGSMIGSFIGAIMFQFKINSQ